MSYADEYFDDPDKQLWAFDKFRRGLLQFLGDLIKPKSLGQGRHRTSYRLKDGRVLKFPNSFDGCDANETEARTFQKYGQAPNGEEQGPNFAQCEIWWVSGIPLLIMEYVEPYRSEEYKNLPSWAYYIDCAQVGYSISGMLVAYDYADM